jgi:sugar/nucleoside kinase (ribokinase family)
MGQRVLAALEKIKGIDTRFLGRKAGLSSMYCIIFVRPDGERAIVGVHTDSVIASPPTQTMIGSAKVLTLDLYGGDERVEAARMARNQGIPVIVGDVRRFDHAVLPYTTTAIASQAELRQEYPGLSPSDCARRILDAGAEAALRTGGAGGILVFDTKEGIARFDPPQVEPVDTTGAGDAFRAGVVYGVLAGYATTRAAMVGAAAGSLAIGRIGAVTDPASLDEVLSLANSLRVFEG